MAASKGPGYHFSAMEADGHYLVRHDVAGELGQVAKVEDGGWRAYLLDGSEVPGGPVFRTRDEAAEGLAEASPA